MRVRRSTVAVLTTILVAYGATSSCTESDSSTATAQQKLPDGKSDSFGPLPETVAGLRVTRGAAAGYVSDKACKECHEDEWTSYQSVGMARSFYPPDPDHVVEDLPQTFHHARTGYYYEMSLQNGKYVLHRYCKDDAGRRFAEYKAQVAWVIGSGNHVRSYLSQTPSGELYQLPISWYTGKGFAMSPMYDRKGHQRFERMVDRGCMFCHNAYPETPVGSDLPHRSHRFPRQLPHGIGCQRCHGPGARHVQKANDPNASDEEIRSRILNPAHFTERQRQDLCMSCHLQPESIRSRMMVRSFQNPMYSLLPGKDLTDFVTYLDHGSATERRERFEINHHGYRLRQSPCYVKSEGKLGCTTCHDPHRKVPKVKHAEYYRKKCMQCHELTDCEMHEMGKTRDPAQSDCISCHMFEARPADVVHVTTTDHFIRRNKPGRDLTAPREEEFPARTELTILPYFPDRKRGDPLYPVYEGFGASYFPTKESLRKWRDAFERTRPHTVAAYVSVARGLLESGDHRGAIDLLNEAATKFQDDAPLHWILGIALLKARHVSAAVAQLERAQELDGSDPGIQAVLADAYWQAGARRKSLETYESAIRSRPNSWPTWQRYGFALYQMQDLDTALHAFRGAIALNPHDAYSYAIVGSILRAQGRTADMFRVLEQGASLLTEVRLDLAAAKLLTDDPKYRDPKAALALADTVAREQPANGRAHLHVAFALLLSGKISQAPTATETARTNGADPACCTALSVLYHTQQNERARVEPLLAQLANDLRRQSQERLRPQLVAYLRSLGLAPR